MLLYRIYMWSWSSFISIWILVWVTVKAVITAAVLYVVAADGVFGCKCRVAFRDAAEQPAPAAHLPEVCWRQLRHRLRRLPHLHRPSGEHVPYVKSNQTLLVRSTVTVNASKRWSLCWLKLFSQEFSRPWINTRGGARTWTSCRFVLTHHTGGGLIQAWIWV